MAEPILCKICGRRRAKRSCPAVQGDICSICCGNERETTLTCPLDCKYLEEAHEHEDALDVAPEAVVDRDVQLSEDFLREQEELVMFSTYGLVQAALRTPGAVDADVMAALESLVRTQRTLDSGLVYESYSENALAASIQRSFTASLKDYAKLRQEREGLSPLKNSDILKTLVFLRRMGQHNQNGRPRGRMFIDLLRRMTPETQVDERAPSILL